MPTENSSDKLAKENDSMRNKVYLLIILAALLCSVGWTAYAQGQRRNSTLQVWEYKSLTFTIEASVPVRTVLYEDGKQTSGTPVSRAPDLGSQGWELVSVAATENPNTSTFIYWFKRPR
jgi:hypothetical protein